jgi:hypothetical protein
MLTFVYWIGNRRFIHQTTNARNALAFVRWCAASGFPVRAAAGGVNVESGTPLRIPA